MKFIYFSLFSLFSMAKGESLCLSYSKCREQLLARRWLCAEDARRATEHPCHLLDDLQSIWKASLWREKVLSRCLSTATEFSLDTNECPPEVSSMTLESPLESPLECGLAMVLHEERCERLQNCCPEEARCFSETLDLPGSRQLYRRRQSAASRATSCRRRMFAAIHSDMTREDISIATVVAQHTGTVLNLLAKMAAEDRKYKNQTAVSQTSSTLPPFFKLNQNKVLNETAVSETSSALPPFFRLNKKKVLNETAVSETSSRLPPFFRLSKTKEKHEVDLSATSPTPPFFKLDKNKARYPPKTAGVPSKQLKHIQVLSVDNHVDSLKVQASGFIQQSSSGYLQQSSTGWTKHKPTIRRPWSNKKITSTGKRRKVKTLFTKFLSSKTRPIKAWRPQAQPLPGLFLVKQNTSRSIGSFHQSQWKDENLAREEINRLKKERASLKQVDSEEVRTEPEVKQPVASEEDFAKEFERKAGSLVSIGQNAIPLPGSRSSPDRVDSHRVEDPLIDVAERAELRPADVSDLVRTTKAPVMRPRLRLTSAPLEGPVFAFTTPNPLWNPLLAFFSTPSPLYLSTHQPIQLWPFKKRRRKLHGAKIFLGEEASPIVSRNILPIPKEDKNNCVKLQECFAKLGEREKNCTTQSTKNGVSTKKTSFCENLNWKFRIEELFKSLDLEFRTCVLKSDVESENMKECAVPPELPEEVYETKDCHRNIVQMRQYCDQLANCCPIAQRCRSTVDNSQSAADLRLRQRRLAMIAANCEKSNSIKGSIKTKKKWQKIRGEAQH